MNEMVMVASSAICPATLTGFAAGGVDPMRQASTPMHNAAAIR
jgi:hypothetical protein